jgi:aconitate hydratase
MGQAPASGRNSLRTTPRNFPGRSGTKEDSVFLCSPETATASALMGEITDPRTLDFDYPKVWDPDDPMINEDLMDPPPTEAESKQVEIVKGPNIVSLPDFDGVPDAIEVPILLKVGDDISTDEIMRAGAEVLPFRSNIPEISRFVYDVVDESYPTRAEETGDHAIIGGTNYGQGSSREHAAIAPRYLGLRVVIAKDYARIHWQNLVNFGVLPLTYADESDHDKLEQGSTLKFEGLHETLQNGGSVTAKTDSGDELTLEHDLSPRQVDVLLAGGLINWKRD